MFGIFAVLLKERTKIHRDYKRFKWSLCYVKFYEKVEAEKKECLLLLPINAAGGQA